MDTAGSVAVLHSLWARWGLTLALERLIFLKIE